MRTAILLVALLVPLAGRGEEAPPAEQHRVGGCSYNGNTCGDAAVSLGLVAYDFKDKRIITGMMPMLGFEVSFFNRHWYRFGVGPYWALTHEGDQAQLDIAIQASFARYVRLSGMRDIRSPGGGRWLAAGCIGIDLR